MTHTERVARLAQESAELRRLADTAVRRARAAADEARHLRETV